MDHHQRDDADSWDERHSGRSVPAPDPWLIETAPVFAGVAPGPILDLACGLGQNTLWLAGLGLDAVGVDASAEAVRRAREEALRRGISARFEVVRLEADAPFHEPIDGPWGGIVVCHFLDRGLFGPIENALRPGGILAYKTHLTHSLRAPGSRPRRRAYLFETGELLRSFPRLRPVAYREWATGGEAFAALLAQMPADHPL
jgi:SAM-dependent methyltransferase